ncbi:unnamed protein product [Caenorhabditis bovis]|uniref:F-box domain-containing protein n=1 Tax=Caenorhabditis bovis TaxID=2654633 RepID=A0A8S1E6S7_9PELO|nr:unnamed protein product [Caenorhabditis bovis]
MWHTFTYQLNSVYDAPMQSWRMRKSSKVSSISPVAGSTLHLDKIPDFCIARILSWCEPTDAYKFRLTCRQVNETFKYYRKQMRPKNLTLFVNADSEGVEYCYRSSDSRFMEPMLIPTEVKYTTMHGARVILNINIKGPCLSHDDLADIYDILCDAKVVRCSYVADTIDELTIDLFNRFENCVFSMNLKNLDVGSICRCTLPNIISLNIEHELKFYELNKITESLMNVKFLFASLSVASLPVITKCVEEFRDGLRTLTHWSFKICAPRDVLQEFHFGVVIGIDRFIIRQKDRSAVILTLQDEHNQPTTHINIKLTK